MVTVQDLLKRLSRARHERQHRERKLVETLAERIAEQCLADLRVQIARIRVEKLDVFADVGSVGVEIVRQRRNLSTR